MREHIHYILRASSALYVTMHDSLHDISSIATLLLKIEGVAYKSDPHDSRNYCRSTQSQLMQLVAIIATRFPPNC